MTEISLIGSRPDVIAPFLRGLFTAFEEAGVVWAIMRGWERLPYWTRYDLDILVAKADAAHAAEIVETVSILYGWIPYGKWNPGSLHSIWLVKCEDETQSYFRIDIETEARYRGILIHRCQKYLRNRVRKDVDSDCWFWRMPDGFSAACVLMKQFAVHGTVDTKQRREQVLMGYSDPLFTEIISDALHDNEIVDGSLSKELLTVIKEQDWDHVNRLARKVKKRVFRFNIGNVFRMLLHGFQVFKDQLHPFMRLVIVFVGPDGSGKTTIADKVEERFRGRPFQGIFRVHMLFGVPRIRNVINSFLRLFGRKVMPVKSAVPGERHVGMGRPHSTIRAMLYVVYYGLGMILGRLRLFFWRTQGGLVIADRFFQDYYYMRGFMNCPIWFIRMIEWVTPHPNFIFSLERPAHDIYEQKPELTEEEIERQQTRIQEALGGRDNFRRIDASHGVDETVSLVTKEIERWIISHSL